MKKILFQGDSITDCGRGFTPEHFDNLGSGYANFVRSSMMADKPGQYEYHNRGISGNRIIDLYARIKQDIINIKPDYMSILIGVNDVWHELELQNGIEADKYEKFYDMLISEVLEALPNLKIMIMEPFVLKGTGTERYYDEFRKEVEERAKRAEKIANKYNLKYIKLQKMFDDACEIMPENYWLADGVHPTHAGHVLLKREWIKAFEEL